MAQININITSTIDKGTASNINSVTSALQGLANTLNGIKPNAELTKQLNALAKSYNAMTKNAANNTKAVNAHAKKITANAKATTANAKAMDAQTRRMKEVRLQQKLNNQETEKGTKVNKQHTQGILSMASGFLKWQLAATLIMQPLQKLRTAIKNINETLIETENTVIGLQRVLDETISDGAIADKLYNLAYTYGQTFENVSDIATNFARSGKSWEETIAATEAALIALNVAELDATQASDGMIAIMAQFKIEADGLMGVIDMLNKVADNFPVTTDKILKALQRTGSAASNANMTLEETIGVITALSEATGRSGENLGTAVNSLIQYSSKASALEIFAKLDEGTARTVEAYKNGAATILDVWEEVSRVINSMNAEQESILSQFVESEDIQNLESELQDELGDIFETVSDVYGTANTFRKNYFISLLGNMKTVREAQAVAQDAEGYSQKENLQYMDSYVAKSNQLAAAWEKLANDEQGILGFRKWLLDVGIGLADAVDKMGGIMSAVAALSGVITGIIVVVKRAAIVQWLSNIKTSITSLFSAATLGAGKLQAALGIFGLISTAIGGIVIATGFLKEESQALADQMTEDLAEIQQHYENLTESIEQSRDAKKSEIALMDSLIDSYDELNNKSYLNAEEQKRLTSIVEELKTVYKDLDFQLDETTGKYSVLTSEIKANREEMKRSLEAEYQREIAKTSYESAQNILKTYGVQNVEELIEKHRQAAQTAKDLQEQHDEWLKTVYSDDLIGDFFEFGGDILSGHAFEMWGAGNEAKGYRDQADALQEAIDSYTAFMNEVGSYLNEFDGTEAEPLVSDLDKIANSFDRAEGAATRAKNALADYVSILSKTHNELSVLTSAMDEYGQHGEISYSTMLKLLEAGEDYIWALEEENGVIKLNLDVIEDLISARKLSALAALEEEKATVDSEIKKARETIYAEAAIQQALIETAKQHLAHAGGLAAEAHWIEVMNEATAAMLNTQNLLYALQVNEEEANKKYEKAKELLEALFENSGKLSDASGELSDTAEKQTKEAFDLYQVLSKIRSVISQTSEAIKEYNENGKISVETATSLINADKRFITALTFENGIIKLNTELLNELTNTKKNETIQTLKDALKDGFIDQTTYEKAVEIVNALLDSTTELGEAAQTAKDRYKELIDTIIEALEAARKKREQNLTLSEKQLEVEERLQDLLNATQERNVRIYNARTGEYEGYQANAKDIQSAEESLKDAVDALNKYIEEQAYDEVISAVKEGVFDLESIKAILEKWVKGESFDWTNDILGVIGQFQYTGRDYLLAKRAANGSYDPTQAEKSRLDTDGDGNITTTDYEVIKDIVAKRFLGDVSPSQQKATLDKLGILVHNADSNIYRPSAGEVIYGNTTATYNNNSGNITSINGVPITPEFAQNHTIEEAIKLLALTKY